MFHENFFDFESILNYLYERPDPKNVNINYVFQVKKSHHTLVIFKSYIDRHILNRIIIRTNPTVVHIGREEIETFSNT